VSDRLDTPKRSVRLNEDEAWAAVSAAHTGILTTLRRDGMPVSTPVWFAVIDRKIYSRTPAKSKKVSRARRDSRATFLVEAGLRWAELQAVHLSGHVTLIEEDDPIVATIEAELQRKYAGFTTPREAMPQATRDHYSVATMYLCFEADGRILSWDNRRLGL
jgi:PPOX class probable F420-dependent enzyme